MPLSVTGAGERTATVARSLPRRQPKATLQYDQRRVMTSDRHASAVAPLRGKTDPSHGGGGRGRRAAGRDGRDGPRDSADVAPWPPAPSGDDRPPGSAACSTHGRDHKPRRWRTGGYSSGRSSGVTAGPRRRSARSELRLDSAAPAVAQQRRPARSVGARDGHEGPAIPGPSPPAHESASTLPDRRATSPARRSSRTPCRSGTRDDDDPPTAVRAPSATCIGVRSVSANGSGAARRSGGFARGRASTPIRTWSARAIAPPPGSPGATTTTDRPHGRRVRQTSLPRHSGCRSTQRPFRFVVVDHTAWPSPAVPSREGTPAGHDQHRRPARNPPGRPDQNSLRSVFCFFRTRSEATRLQIRSLLRAP